MVMVFSAATRLEAWLDATEYLMRSGPELNVILSISSPASDGPGGRAAADSLNAFYRSEAQPPLHTIAETIFPGWEYRRRGLRGVFESYAAEYDEIRKGGQRGWGTYAIRLIRRTAADGTVVNPLKVMIAKMRDEKNHDAGGTKAACYEIGVAQGEYDLPLYNTADDQNKRLGLPCLSHLSFKLFEGSVHLTAFYRSHDYRHKVPGNLLGLARLQACVAKEVGLRIGGLVIHSTYGWVGRGRGKGALRGLIADLRGLAPRRNE